jgi:hypothetical protein
LLSLVYFDVNVSLREVNLAVVVGIRVTFDVFEADQLMNQLLACAVEGALLDFSHLHFCLTRLN